MVGCLGVVRTGSINPGSSYHATGHLNGYVQKIKLKLEEGLSEKVQNKYK